MTPHEASTKLHKMGLEAENENYHSLAGMLFDLSVEARCITERTLIVIPLEYDGIERILVQP